jgi:hypothetical protein
MVLYNSSHFYLTSSVLAPIAVNFSSNYLPIESKGRAKAFMSCDRPFISANPVPMAASLNVLEED